MNNNTKLGRGLSGLMGELTFKSVEPTADRVVFLSLNDIVISALQPRKNFDQGLLRELADSIEQKGVISPITVRALQGGRYEIVAGERRFRAAGLANIKQIPVIIKELTDQQALEIAIIENVQRRDLNPIEEARSYQQLIEKFGYTHEQIAKTIGKSRSHITNLLRVLALPESLILLVEEGKISVGHAKVLVGAKDPEILAQKVVNTGMSVRELESTLAQIAHETSLVRNIAASDDITTSTSKSTEDIKYLEDVLSKKFKMPVSISVKRNNSGSVRLYFSTLEELDSLIS